MLTQTDNATPSQPTNQTQVGGDHYISLSVQPWAAMASWLSHEGFAGYLRGNVIKYLARRKGDRQGRLADLRKARHYLDKLIGELEQGNLEP